MVFRFGDIEPKRNSFRLRTMPVNVSNRKYVVKKRYQIEHNTFQGRKQFKSALSTYTQDLIQCLNLDSLISRREEIKLYLIIILA